MKNLKRSYFTKMVFIISLIVALFLTGHVAHAETPDIPVASNPKTATNWAQFVTYVADVTVDEINVPSTMVATGNISASNFPARNLTIKGGTEKATINMAGYSMLLGGATSESLLSFQNINFLGTGTTEIIDSTVANSTNWVVNFQNTDLSAPSNTKTLIYLVNGRVYFSGNTALKLTNTATMITANKLFIEDGFKFSATNTAETATTTGKLWGNAVTGGSVAIEHSDFSARTGGNVFNSTGTSTTFSLTAKDSTVTIPNAGYFYSGTGKTTFDFSDTPVNVGTISGSLMYTSGAGATIVSNFASSPITGTSIADVIFTAGTSSRITASFIDSPIDAGTLGGVIQANSFDTSNVTASFERSQIRTTIANGAIVSGGILDTTFEQSPISVESNYTQPLFVVAKLGSVGSNLKFNASDVYIRQSTSTAISTFSFAGKTALTMSNSKVDARIHGIFFDFSVKGNKDGSILTLNEGSVLNINSRVAQVLNVGSAATVEVADFQLVISDVDTVVNMSGSSDLVNEAGGIVSIIGLRSKVYVSKGAKLNINSTKALNTTSAVMIQASGGGFYVSDQGEVNLTGGGVYSSAFYFRIGGMTLDVSDNSLFSVKQYGDASTFLQGNAAAVRVYGSDNVIKVRSNSTFSVYNQGRTGSSSGDGGPVGTGTGNVGISYAAGSSGGNVFDIQDSGSNATIISDKGPAIDGTSFPLTIDAGKDTYFVARGRTTTATVGIFTGGQVKMNLDEPRYFDFTNNRPGGGRVLSTTNANATFSLLKSNLSLWNSSTKVNVNGNPSISFNQIDLNLKGSGFGTFVSGSSSVQSYFATAGRMNNITRMNGNNQRAKIDDLRVPTNADKYIWAHASVAEGRDEGNRDAWTDEVTLRLGVYNKDTSLAYILEGKSIGNNDNDGGLSIYGESKRAGIIKIPIPEGKYFETGQTIRLLKAWRGTQGEFSPETIVSQPEDLLADDVVGIDVTPPDQVASATIVNNATKQLAGTSPANGSSIFVKVNGSWLKDEADNAVTTVVENDKWTISLPSYLPKEAKVDVYIKEHVTINPVPTYSLPDTYTLEPDGLYGNVNEEVDGYTSYAGYHDAVDTTLTGGGDNRFEPAIRKLVDDILPHPTFVKSVESNGGKTTAVGDTLTYTLVAKNNNDVSYDWENVEFTDVLPEGLVFTETDHGITLNGEEVESTGYNYTEATRALVIKAGNISANQTVTVTFKVTISQSVLGESIVNRALASGDSPQEDPFVSGAVDPEATRMAIAKESNDVLLPGGQVVAPTISTVKVRFVNEADASIYDAVTISQTIRKTVDLTANVDVLTALSDIAIKHYELTSRPASELVVVKETETVITYKFSGTLIIESAPEHINFGTQENRVTGTKLDSAETDKPLIIWDNRVNLTKWKLTLTLEEPLRNQTDTTKILADAIRYKNNTGEIILSDEAMTIESQTHAAAGRVEISQSWGAGGNGFKLDVPAGSVRKLGEYQATIIWKLGNTP